MSRRRNKPQREASPSEEQSSRTEGQEAPQEKTLRLTTLPYPKRHYLWPAIFASNAILIALSYFGYAVRASPKWLWRHRGKFLTAFWRTATLLSVGYLVYDRIYETG